jgi:adenosylhomocysteine nucleosidase
MEVIGIIGAMDEEVLALKEKMTLTEVRSIASLEFFVGTLNNASVVVVHGGIGKVNAALCTQILIDCFHIDAVINTGVAGALSNDLEIGDVIISSDTIQHDVDATGFGYELGEVPRMGMKEFRADEHLISIAQHATDVLPSKTNVFTERIVSGDQFVADSERKAYIKENFGGFCTEMEGAAIGQVCTVNKIPFVIIRSVSDKADDSAEMNFAEFTQLAANHSCKILMKMLEILNG